MSDPKVRELLDWGARARDALAEILAEEERSSGPDAALDLKALIDEFSDLEAGRETWRHKLLQKAGDKAFDITGI